MNTERETDNFASGVVLLVFGLTVAALGGSVMKLLAETLPAAQITWVRFLGYFIIMIPLILIRLGPSKFKPARPRWQIVRGIVLAISTISFVTGVKTLDYADAIAILYAYPFMVIVMARFFLGERPPLMAWIGVAGGFIGVLLVVRPDLTGINSGALWVLLCSVFVAAQLTLNRFLGSVSHPFVTSFWGALVATIVLSPLAWSSWEMPNSSELWWLLLLVVMGAVNQTIIVIAFTRAEAAKLAPFTYAEMIAGIVAGLFMFGTLPDALSWAGMGLIVLFGVLAARAFAHRNVPKRTPRI